ncbi:MAG: cupin domain-containing protein [Proteobacteria bacterium]|nr:cupin domain-containing protein [Pseudomonadota bacterium]
MDNNLKGLPLNLKDLVNYQEGSIVSREILRKRSGTLTIFAFDKGQGLSEHTAPFDATVYIIDGVAEIRIDKKIHMVKEGQMIIMPSNIPHAINAIEKFKMLLIMIRSED